MAVEDKRTLVLTVDDEKVIRDSFRFFFEDLGYGVIEAENGRAGIEIFNKERPDVVLVDLRMPEVDGLKVLEHIHSESPDVPVIVVSGTGVIGDAIKALRLGAWDYILKPIEDLTALKFSVDKVLERARLISENRRYHENLEILVKKRTAALEKVQTELEARVRERTLELAEMNVDLEKAVARAKEMAIKAEKANASKSRFLASMSHEIRTPMNGVTGMLELMLDTGLTSGQKIFAETARNSAYALLTIINDILDYSKIEAGKLRMEKIDFDLRTTIDDINGLFALRCAEKELEFVCVVDHNVPSFLRGDPGRLRQIINNFIGNSVKFTPEGSIVLKVSLEKETPAEAVILFQIIDTGIGISDEQLDILFDEYAQAETSTARKFGGTGLGLSISRRLSEMMGGEIGAESNSEKGATFWFKAVFEKQSEQKKAGLLSGDIRDKRILIADPGEASRRAVKEHLMFFNCGFEEKRDGRRIIERLRQAISEGAPFHAVIADIDIEGPGAEELAHKIKKEALISETKLIVMTNAGIRGDAARFESAGYDAYLMKPVKKADLVSALSAVFAPGTGKSGMDGKKIITRHTISENRKMSIKILIAEDDETNQMVAKGMLSKLGYLSDIVSDGKEAVDVLKRKDYDLVLMDRHMPNMNGIEAVKKIRDPETGVKNPNIPVLAMTASAMTGEQRECLDAGMNGFIAKPVNPEELEGAIEKNIIRK